MEYFKRAEAIKQMLDSVDRTANSQAKATGATATKAKPRGHDDNEDSDLEKIGGSLGGLILEEKPDVKVGAVVAAGAVFCVALTSAWEPR
jgi:biotin carboxyl carrier protein